MKTMPAPTGIPIAALEEVPKPKPINPRSPFLLIGANGEKLPIPDNRYGHCHRCQGFIRTPGLERYECNSCGWIPRKGYCEGCAVNLSTLGSPVFGNRCGRTGCETPGTPQQQKTKGKKRK